MMSRDKARIVMLESCLEQAVNNIEFLQSCLTDGRFADRYPQHRASFLKDAKKLLPELSYCVHSRREPGCPSCAKAQDDLVRLREAKAVLGL